MGVQVSLCVCVCVCVCVVTGNGSKAAGKWGDYQCDVPYRTLESLMQFIAGMIDEVKNLCTFTQLT